MGRASGAEGSNIHFEVRKDADTKKFTCADERTNKEYPWESASAERRKVCLPESI